MIDMFGMPVVDCSDEAVIRHLERLLVQDNATIAEQKETIADLNRRIEG